MEFVITGAKAFNLTFWTSGNCTVYYLEPNLITFDKTVIEESQINFVDFGNVKMSAGTNIEDVVIVSKIKQAFVIGANYIRLRALNGGVSFNIDTESPYKATGQANTTLNYTYFNFRVR